MYKLFKVNFSILIFIEYVDDPLHQRILEAIIQNDKSAESIARASLYIQIYILIEGILITCCNSGNDINSSTDSDPELSRSSFLNRFPNRLISSASKLVAISICRLASFPILLRYCTESHYEEWWSDPVIKLSLAF